MSNSIDQLAEGGRGIKLMWQIADELSYTRTFDGRNCLSLSKSYEVESRSRSQNIKKASPLDGFMNLLKKKWDWQDDIEQEAELNESSVKNINLQVNTDVNALTRVLDWFEQLQDVSIPTEAWFQFQLALAEGFTNAVRHAHKNLPVETPIQLQITVFNGHWELKIWDCGPRFDFDAKLAEIIIADRKCLADLEVLNDTCLIPSRPATLEISQFRIAG
ncbi:MAG: ATP-binding protein [Microcoleus sp. PH2017_10_PVI_O_A]|uniref:ATP-binding protein n=1 Tax=unclassified Microcoleus TaxID=2642155 RepID=UPI001D4560F4|nr:MULTISPECIES: ATP-binding protein [unclassified Microcoleus]TAE77509.1 MAG: ATP-binding protein [Oscillatoriales cyanobacterium]MCC3406069.1 ATP-binding protein [Microcoleus sp. PH2017_10_PVI_O_A]MCC3460183.1 ATP-binding protein [Microcoleus sp. PH2017_11_PCY_U_A]MCC3478606.1 ATP-binding protein [Microcoleus sp. PH2017_12_PCY_D_A]MCC3529968.1 ATP-binding protein [Microcoleus sp. PH2017_21_RUC_O_A]